MRAPWVTLLASAALGTGAALLMEPRRNTRLWYAVRVGMGLLPRHAPRARDAPRDALAAATEPPPGGSPAVPVGHDGAARHAPRRDAAQDHGPAVRVSSVPGAPVAASKPNGHRRTSRA